MRFPIVNLVWSQKLYKIVKIVVVVGFFLLCAALLYLVIA